MRKCKNITVLIRLTGISSSCSHESGRLLRSFVLQFFVQPQPVQSFSCIRCSIDPVCMWLNALQFESNNKCSGIAFEASVKRSGF